MVTERHVGRRQEPTLRDLSEALVAACGSDYGIPGTVWISSSPGRPSRPRPIAMGVCCWPAMPPLARAGWRRAGPQQRCAGCRQSGMEAGSGGQGHIARQFAGQQTTPGAIRWEPACCAGPWRPWRYALPPGRERATALRDTVAELVEMDEPREAFCRDAVRPGRSLRPRRRTSAARTPHAPISDVITANGPLRVSALLLRGAAGAA